MANIPRAFRVKAAIEFVRSRGSPREKEALRLLSEPGPPSQEVVSDLLAGQRTDGGWSYARSAVSSINETIWRLTQACELGLGAAYPSVMAAAGFLAGRQDCDGSWQEDQRLAGECPPWAAPGLVEATVYLTASAGYSLAILSEAYLSQAGRASEYLSSILGPEGRLPSYIHAHWLACGLWWALGRRDLAGRVAGYLRARLAPDIPDNNLSWAAVTLLAAGYPATSPLMVTILDMLESRQAADGHFSSEDGETLSVHATWEAVKALTLAGRVRAEECRS